MEAKLRPSSPSRSQKKRPDRTQAESASQHLVPLVEREEALALAAKRAQVEAATAEIESRAALVHEEAKRTAMEARHIAAETSHRESETGDLDFAVFRKGVFFVLAVAIVVILIFRLLTDPSMLSVVGGGGAVAALNWLFRR